MINLQNKKLVSHLTAAEIQYDTISDTKYHWKVSNWRIRQLKGLRETITSGASKDTTIMMEPTDLVFSKGQQETFTSPQLRDYITKQIDRGSGNVVQYEVEYHKRIATSFASFILATIGLSLSSRKERRHGNVSWHRTGPQLYIHHVTDSFCNICDKRKYPSYASCMDSEYSFHNSGIFLLP